MNSGRNTSKNRRFTRVSGFKKRQKQAIASPINNLSVMEESEIEDKIIEIPKDTLILKIIKLEYLNVSEYRGL